MAKPKKKPAAKKSSRSAAKKPAAKARAARKPTANLSADARQALLRSRSGADDVGESIVPVWQKEKGLRVDGLTAKKLLSLMNKLRKAKTKESTLADAQARKMAPVRDARMTADDGYWRGLLDLLAAVRLRARKDPTILERFAALIDLMTNEVGGTGEDPQGGGGSGAGT